MRPVMARMARWDRETANRADRYVAISHYVAGRIRRYYNREAIVVYPPVDTEFFHPDDTVATRQALVVSALVPYKRIDVAIDACRLAGVPLTIVGDGPDRARLERAAGAGRAVPGLGVRRDDSRFVPPVGGHAPAGRRGFRHRAARSPGVRTSGRRARTRRRAGDGGAGGQRRARGRPGSRARSPTRSPPRSTAASTSPRFGRTPSVSAGLASLTR